MSQQTPPLTAERPIQKRRWKDYKSQRLWTTQRKRSPLDTTGLIHTETVSTQTKHVHVQVRRNLSQYSGANVDSVSHPQPRNYLQLMLTSKRKKRFFQQRLTGYINHILGQALCLGAVGQYKTNLIVFCTLFLFCLNIFWSDQSFAYLF